MQKIIGIGSFFTKLLKSARRALLGWDTMYNSVTAYRFKYVDKSSHVKNGKVFPYSLPSVGPGADPGVQAVSPQVT